MNTPTASQAHYIKAVFELSSASCDGSARVVDIANKTGVSKASASLAMSKLEKERLVRSGGRFISLRRANGLPSRCSTSVRLSGTSWRMS